MVLFRVGRYCVCMGEEVLGQVLENGKLVKCKVLKIGSYLLILHSDKSHREVQIGVTFLRNIVNT